MAKSSTSFTPATAPKGKGGCKHKKTILKESIGLDGWENLCNFLKGEGSDKLKVEINKLKGKDYVLAITQLVEFVKPKLQRTTLSNDPDNPINPVSINITTVTSIPISESE